MKNILFPRLYPEAVVDGSSVLPPGLELEVKTVTGDREVRYLAVFHNRGSVARHLDAIRFTARPEPGDFLSFPGREYRIFLEGWTMVTPAKSVPLRGERQLLQSRLSAGGGFGRGSLQ